MRAQLDDNFGNASAPNSIRQILRSHIVVLRALFAPRFLMLLHDAVSRIFFAIRSWRRSFSCGRGCASPSQHPTSNERDRVRPISTSASFFFEFGQFDFDFGQFRLRPNFDFGQLQLRPISTSANFDFGQFDFGQFLDVEFWDDTVWGPQRVGPQRVEAQTLEKVEPRRVGAPKGGDPEGWGAQNFALFFPSSATIFFLLSLSWGFLSWNFGGFFEGRGPEMCTFEFSGCRVRAPDFWRFFLACRN